MLVPREHSHSSVKDASSGEDRSNPSLFNDRLVSLLY